MKPADPRNLTIHGGSSSINFALFEAGDSLRRILEGMLSATAGRVAVRVIRTELEIMIVRLGMRVIGPGEQKEI